VRPPPGYTSRPAVVEDAAAVAELMNAVDRAHVEDPDEQDAASVAGWWQRLDLGRDSLQIEDEAGALAAAATVYERSRGKLELDAYVRPDRTGRGLGSTLLDWGEREARRRGCEAVQTGILGADQAARRLVLARGFVVVRHFYRMLVDLDGPPPEPSWPEGFTVATFRPGEEEILHAVTEDAFAEHWGYSPETLEQWQSTVFGREWWDPTLVYLVRAGEEVAAAEINALRFGMGWVGTLGTRKPWRGRGLGRALLLHAFGELYRRGERRIGLAVDAGNETGATHLYESVGMRVAWQADVYEKSTR
jgi:mycothiol synthase